MGTGDKNISFPGVFETFDNRKVQLSKAAEDQV